MSSTPANRVTAQDFYDHDKCPHRVYLNRHGDSNEKLPQSDFLNLLFERALLHEADVVKDLPYEMPRGETLKEQASATLELMKVGAERIYQAVLLLPEDSGKPDLLEKVPGESKFGDFFYKPVDIKSGSGYEDEQARKLRADYRMQLFHYGKLLEQIQGTFPPEGEIFNKRKERVSYSLAEFSVAYAEAYPEIRALVSGAKSDEPAAVNACNQCQWWGHCEGVLVKQEDVSLLPGLGREKKAVLNQAGLRRISDVPSFDFRTNKLKGIGEKTAQSMVRSARAALTGKWEVIQKPKLPDASLRIYLDFEDDPTQELVYLTGLWAEPAIRGLNYHGLFCKDAAGEAAMWRDFQRLCSEISAEDFLVFHYSPYEKTKIAALERKYGVEHPDALENFRKRMLDLLPVVRSSLAVPTRSYSLKQIAPMIGMEYADAEASGVQAIVWFQAYQEDPSRKDLTDKILNYNREDCLALKAVYEWLKGL